MSIILAVVLTVSAAPVGGAPADAAPAAKAAAAVPAMRTGRELADAAHAALRKWAKATDPEADAAAKELLVIYCELQQDTQMARSTRETLRTTVRARLDQLSTQISKRIAKEKPAQADAKVKSVAAAGDEKPLAQVGLPAIGGAGRAAAPTGPADYGQALVDLIQSTISPKSWDVNGGNATIYYWQQQHAIVVRATSELHGQISDALDQLNRATH
jgi:hypothetical protein